MTNDFSERIRKAKQARPNTPSRAADTFAPSSRTKEPVQRTTVNIPQGVYEELREEAFRTGVPMGTQLINAWKAERGWP